MIAAGELVEIGQLEDVGGALGFVLKRPDGTFITVEGLTIDETRAAVHMLLQKVAVKMETPP